jgi:hypothetical protein
MFATPRAVASIVTGNRINLMNQLNQPISVRSQHIEHCLRR